MIVIVNKRAPKKIDDLKNKGYTIVDVTSKSSDFAELSPFYPHGDIVIDKYTSESVEGIWQGLKVFDSCGIDTTKFTNKTMKNLKRSCRKYGCVRGHLFENKVIPYIEARKKIYIPAYNNMLLKEKVATKLAPLLNVIKGGGCLALLDYDINEEIDNITKPLSHASCIKRHLLSLL